jgi:hypothetical protein
MARTTKRAKRTGKPSITAATVAGAEDKASAKRDGMVLHIRLQMLHKAETLARSIGPEGIAERRLNLARDDEKFQAFMADYVRPSREL